MLCAWNMQVVPRRAVRVDKVETVKGTQASYMKCVLICLNEICFKIEEILITSMFLEIFSPCEYLLAMLLEN